LVIAAIWPLLIILVVIVVVAVDVARAHRAAGLIAINVNFTWALGALLLVPPVAFIGFAAIARRGSTRR